jgi:DNA-binding GntR family transcriptional regulator
MEFREAIDRLGERVTHEQVAEALGVSVASVRQYRLSADAKAHRSPARGWRASLAQLARNQSRKLANLADELERKS